MPASSKGMQASHPSVTLPHELLWRIAYFLTTSTSSTVTASPSEWPDDFSKPSWADVNGFSLCSKALRSMALRSWFRILHIREGNDWEEYSLKYSFIFKHATSVHWHGALDAGSWIGVASRFLEQITNLRSLRIILPVPADFLFDLEYQPTFEDYMKAIPHSIRELEVINFLYPAPENMRFIAEAVPDLAVLRMQQPAIWCSLCFTCSIPHFARPFPIGRAIVYNDGRGLPALYAARLAGLTKLHTVVITVAVERGVLSFDEQMAYSWAGECEMCMLMMSNDAGFRETCTDRKRNNDNIPQTLRRVEWHFRPISTFEDDWTRIMKQLYE